MLVPVMANAEATSTSTSTSTAKKSVTSAKKAPVKKATDDYTVTEMEEMTVTEKIVPTAKKEYNLPTTTESITSEKIDNTINAMTSEDTIKYLPSIQVRQRYIGDTNAPVGWRTSGTGASARGLIYADGILIASLLGNNNGNTGSPLWNLVTPSEIERVDVMYGPFASAYSGNSMGGIIDIKTKMPEKFQVGGNVKSAWQNFSNYGKDQTFDSQEYTGNVGDKYKDFSFRFDVSHLDSHSQPITYANPLLSSTAAGASTPVTGAINNKNPYGVNALVLGQGSMNHTVQDNFKWKFGYDINKSIHAAYTLGLWTNTNNGNFSSYLIDGNGQTVNSGNVNIGGKKYSLSGTNTPGATQWGTGTPTFSNSIANQTKWMQGMRIHSDTGGVFDWDISGSIVNYATDYARVATLAPQYQGVNQAGRVTSLTGTGWNTADAKGMWRPATMILGKHDISFGFHNDFYNLNNPVYNVKNWQSDNQGTMYSNSQGKTQTQGYWLQDSLDFNKQWNLTTGGRLESWHAFDGFNSSTLSNGQQVNTQQMDRNDVTFSPKGKLTWKPTNRIQTGFSIAEAYRFPTVTEMYQSTPATGGVSPAAYSGNAYLKPEHSLSSELSNEYFFDEGKVRLSLFQERVRDAIFSQTILLANGGTSTSSQNIGETKTYGIEISGEKSNVGIRGIDLYGSATWADSRITQANQVDAEAAALPNSSSNPSAQASAEGKRQPRVPEWRASGTIAYRPIEKLNTSISGRYSSPQFSQLNNSDINAATYGSGGTSYFIVDLHANYKITKQVTAAAGIDNITDQEVWLFHPFPARTYFAEIKYNY